jgi:tight adherence protein B
VTAVLIAVAALALCLALSPARAPARRVRAVLSGASARIAAGTAGPPPGRWASRLLGGWRHRKGATVPMTVVVQQLAALLKGGRTPSRLWDELWTLYAGEPSTEPHPVPGATLAPGSLAMLAAARSAALRGAPVGVSIRNAGAALRGRAGATRRESDASRHESRIWAELAACFDIAEASGCPLADVLTRFAAQLDAEDDAEAARQTALAGPRATVRLLTWLPVLGLGLGMLLGVDPLATLLGTPFGLAALAAGTTLTVAGRTWSARLVRSAAGLPQ